MVVIVVGDSGGAPGGFGEHGGGCPLVADELGDAAPDTRLAVWVQPAAPATRTTAIAARRVRRNFQADIRITHLKPGSSFLKSLVQDVRSCRKRQMTVRVGTIGLLLARPGGRALGRRHRQLGLRRSGAQMLAGQARRVPIVHRRAKRELDTRAAAGTLGCDEAGLLTRRFSVPDRRPVIGGPVRQGRRGRAGRASQGRARRGERRTRRRAAAPLDLRTAQLGNAEQLKPRRLAHLRRIGLVVLGAGVRGRYGRTVMREVSRRGRELR